jgi:hypothetical protein
MMTPPRFLMPAFARKPTFPTSHTLKNLILTTPTHATLPKSTPHADHRRSALGGSQLSQEEDIYAARVGRTMWRLAQRRAREPRLPGRHIRLVLGPGLKINLRCPFRSAIKRCPPSACEKFLVKAEQWQRQIGGGETDCPHARRDNKKPPVPSVRRFASCR